ncbi:DUF1642 domain-containing protein [Lacticaseibacillus paracasei]|uniref:DUF1642 domain-containing protein n=1 Tax=Lacticaseibacillus paracasei TaxID=1597 RepID=UPI000F0BCDCD|nr:DUF1642 domain-containing protein [Lacticaseibacillus paracasei]RNE05538.1 hypothetical protein FAM22278_02230 [Lacticaseibacillus paracasei]
MSGEKLYMVKNDEGSYIAVTNGWLVHWHENSGDLFSSYQEASKWATTLDGHVVTLIEEPEKVVLTKEQAEIVERAHDATWPATYISESTGNSDGEESLLIEAFANGYTVAKEKKYNVKVPQTQTSYYYKGSDGHVHASDTSGGLDNQFSDYELQQYGLDGERFTKEEVTDDGK